MATSTPPPASPSAPAGHRIEETPWESCLLEPARDPALEREVRAEIGFVPPVVRYFTACPWMVRALAAFNVAAPGRVVYLDRLLCDEIALVVSQDSSCRYCYAAQRFLLRARGIPEARIRQLEEEALRRDRPDREAAALDFARALSRGSPLPPEREVRALRETGWPDLAIVELAVVATSWVAGNRFATLPALPPEPWEQLPDRWIARVLGPLLLWRLGRRFGGGRIDPPAPGPGEGPFAYVVASLDGLPFARSVRRVLDESWDSPLLPRRTKALVYAVVGRSLGCPLSEAEGARLLEAEGFGRDRLAPVLDHLDTTGLEPLDAAVVPFARETVRYEPVAIQRHARALAAEIGVAPFLEAVGIAASANMLCRLGAATQALQQVH